MLVAREVVPSCWEDNAIGLKTSSASKTKMLAIEPSPEFSLLRDNRNFVTMKAAPKNETHILQVGGARP